MAKTKVASGKWHHLSGLAPVVKWQLSITLTVSGSPASVGSLKPNEDLAPAVGTRGHLHRTDAHGW